jgi:hypothetical protein
MSLAQLHDPTQHCPECKLRYVDARRVAAEAVAGRALVVDTHSGCGHILAYRTIHPVRYGPEPVVPPAVLPVVVRRRRRTFVARNAAAWRQLSA